VLGFTVRLTCASARMHERSAVLTNASASHLQLQLPLQSHC
jgi:hypothetical protein